MAPKYDFLHSDAEKLVPHKSQEHLRVRYQHDKSCVRIPAIMTLRNTIILNIWSKFEGIMTIYIYIYIYIYFFFHILFLEDTLNKFRNKFCLIFYVLVPVL
jgi:hypothetical protein